VEKNKRPRYESAQLCPPAFLTKAPKTYDGEKIATSPNIAGKIGYLSCRELKLDPC
jgi:hypothetical protein